MPWTWTLRCIGIVRTMIIFGHLICLKVLWWDVSVLWGQYLHHRHHDLWIIHLILWCVFSFLRWLWLSLWGRHCFDTTLTYTVDWLLQWSKDFSDTTVFGWPTLTMSNRSFYSTLKLEAVRCYLYVESWFGERTLCSDNVLYPEEGCTDTLYESLRSWEVSQLVTNELVIHVWMRTSLFWELLEVFRWFLNSSSEIEFCRLLAAGIVSTNLYLKNLRFVNWKPGIEFTSWDIGSKDWCQKFI